jgi:hypothetical protein
MISRLTLFFAAAVLFMTSRLTFLRLSLFYLFYDQSSYFSATVLPFFDQSSYAFLLRLSPFFMMSSYFSATGGSFWVDVLGGLSPLLLGGLFPSACSWVDIPGGLSDKV